MSDATSTAPAILSNLGADKCLHLRDLPASIIPSGFRQATSGNVIPDDMSSGSHSARRIYFVLRGSKLVSADAASVDDDEATVEEEQPESAQELTEPIAAEEEDKEEEQGEPAPKRFKTSCGRVIGYDIDGSQCACAVCSGELDPEDDDE